MSTLPLDDNDPWEQLSLNSEPDIDDWKEFERQINYDEQNNQLDDQQKEIKKRKPKMSYHEKEEKRRKKNAEMSDAQREIVNAKRREKRALMPVEKREDINAKRREKDAKMPVEKREDINAKRRINNTLMPVKTYKKTAKNYAEMNEQILRERNEKNNNDLGNLGIGLRKRIRRTKKKLRNRIIKSRKMK